VVIEAMTWLTRWLIGALEPTHGQAAEAALAEAAGAAGAAEAALAAGAALAAEAALAAGAALVALVALAGGAAPVTPASDAAVSSTAPVVIVANEGSRKRRMVPPGAGRGGRGVSPGALAGPGRRFPHNINLD